MKGYRGWESHDRKREVNFMPSGGYLKKALSRTNAFLNACDCRNCVGTVGTAVGSVVGTLIFCVGTVNFG